MAVVAALWLVPGADPKSKTLIDAAVLVGFAIACWTFGWLAEPAATLVFFLLVVVFHVARPEVVFSGFASSAWWLVLGGSITAIAVQTTGLGRRLAGLLLGRAAGSYPRAVTTVALAAAGLAALTTATGVPAVLTPLAHEFAAASGLPLLTVLMLQVVVFSTVFLPFESPPMMVAPHLGGVGVRPAGKLCLALAAVTLLVLLPLDYLWWQLLGYLP